MADAVAKGTLASRLQMQRTAKLLLAAASAPREAELALRAPSIAERNSKLLGRPQSARSDPELLQKLLCFVNQELHHTDPHSSSYIDERLNVFRRAFGHFTAAYGAYAPLLDAVREAYESALQQARLRAAGVDALSERLALIQDEASRMIERLRDDAATQQAQMMATVEERETEVRAANRENELLRDEVKTLRSQLELKNRQLDDINLRNVELAKQVRSARRAVRVRARVHACPRSGLSMRGFARARACVPQIGPEHAWLRSAGRTVAGRDGGRAARGVGRGRRDLGAAPRSERLCPAGGDLTLGGHGDETGLHRTAHGARAAAGELGASLATQAVAGGAVALPDPTQGDQGGGGRALEVTEWRRVAPAVPKWARVGHRVPGHRRISVRRPVPYRTPPPGPSCPSPPPSSPSPSTLLTHLPIRDDLPSCRYVDPGWRGQRPHAIIAGLVDDLIALHTQLAPPAAPAAAPATLFTMAEPAQGASHRSDEARPMRLLRGQVSDERERAGSSYAGWVRLRPDLWSTAELRATVAKLWFEYKRKMVAAGGVNGRRTFGSEDITPVALLWMRTPETPAMSP